MVIRTIIAARCSVNKTHTAIVLAEPFSIIDIVGVEKASVLCRHDVNQGAIRAVLRGHYEHVAI